MTDVRDSAEYLTILDDVMEKWLGPDFFSNRLSHLNKSEPYRMLALLLDDPWNDTIIKQKDGSYQYMRTFIVDVTNPEIQRKLDLLNGPYFSAIMKMLELRMLDEDSENSIMRNANSCSPLV